MANKPDEWTKELEAELATLASDMWGAQQRLSEKGFRIDGGNKSHSGWQLTANNRNTSRCIKVQWDGTKIAVTAEGGCPSLACRWYKPVVSISTAGRRSNSDLTGISCAPLRIP